MRRLFLKPLLITYLLLGATTAQASFNFDVNGDTAPGGLVFIDIFDWAPGNVLFDNAIPIPEAPGTVDFIFRGQGTLSSFGANPATLDTGAEITFVFEIPSIATIVGSAGGFEFGSHGTLGGGTIEIFYDNTGPGGLGTTGGLVSDDISGTGYADGRLIGTASVSAQTPAEFGSVIIDTSTNLGPLDQNPPDNQAPVTTVSVSGNITHSLEWTFLDDSFFVDVADPGGLANMKNPTGADATWTSDTSAPFFNANPSDLVNGVTPNYGDTINDFACSSLPGGASCDLHAEADSRMPFNNQPVGSVPEPASLLLIGLGLAGLGFARRRRVLG